MSKYVAAQKLNRRIQIQQNFGTVDGRWFQLEDWRTIATLWSQVIVARGASTIGQEFIAGGVDTSRIAASFRIRRRDGIDAGMRVVHDGKNYDIRAVLPDLQDNRYVDLGCAQGANRG